MKPRKVKIWVENVSMIWAPQDYTYVEYCALENFGRKIQFMKWSGALIPWEFFPQMFLLFEILVFSFPWIERGRCQ
jgi:hypothetical protein